MNTAPPQRLVEPLHEGSKAARCGLSFRHMRGLSLVEVLVASVVLSVGLLGLAGLQATGLRVGQSSIYRSQAAQLAYDMVERIRANAPNAGSYAILFEEATPSGDSIAARDLQDWRQRLRALPGGAGEVRVPGSVVTVVVQWDDTRGGSALRGGSEDDAGRTALSISRYEISVNLAN